MKTILISDEKRKYCRWEDENYYLESINDESFDLMDQVHCMLRAGHTDDVLQAIRLTIKMRGNKKKHS